MFKAQEEKGQKSEANFAKSDNDTDSDSSEFSLSITLTIYCSEESEWILDTGATYHVCPKREWFASFKN